MEIVIVNWICAIKYSEDTLYEVVIMSEEMITVNLVNLISFEFENEEYWFCSVILVKGEEKKVIQQY